MPTAAPVTQATFCATVVDEWARAGLGAAFVAPGSRSTPLALALQRDPRIAVHVFHDERAAAFAALGAGRATGVPAVVLCTSGTAATHLHAAVVEADLACVPLLVCTADRSPELRDVGAPQAIDQTHLYGRAPRWFVDPGVPDEATRHRWRPLAARAVAAATAPTAPGPVHLNLPFREPLVADAAELPAGRAGGPWLTGSTPAAVVHDLRDLPGPVLVVAGSGADRGLGRGGGPVLADALSGLDGPAVVAHADPILRHASAAETLVPGAVVRVGGLPASRVVNEWLAALDAPLVVVGPGWSDPSGQAERMLAPGAVQLPPADPAYLAAWRAADDAAEAAIAATLAGFESCTEPAAARAVIDALPAGAQLVVASSMPIRDVEWFAPRRADITVHANRGANGIDGTIGTAIGVALGSGRPTAALLGDLAFLHDSTALIGVRSRPIDLVLVVIDNDGGGIFSFLPQAAALDVSAFEALYGTPHGVRPEDLAAAHGIASLTVEAPDALVPALSSAVAAGGVWLVVVRTERGGNVAVHDELNAAVGKALAR